MTEYDLISREEACKDSLTVQTREYGSIEVVPVDYLQSLKAADVQPVKRGHWEEHHATYIKQLDAWFVQAKCSCCGRYSDKMDNYSQYLDLEYCSHCDVRMMKEGNTNG